MKSCIFIQQHTLQLAACTAWMQQLYRRPIVILFRNHQNRNRQSFSISISRNPGNTKISKERQALRGPHASSPSHLVGCRRLSVIPRHVFSDKFSFDIAPSCHSVGLGLPLPCGFYSRACLVIWWLLMVVPSTSTPSSEHFYPLPEISSDTLNSFQVEFRGLTLWQILH